MTARCLSAAVMLTIACVTAQAQSLSQLVSDARADWMFGQWEARDDNGSTVRLDISWDLDKHVVVMHVKTAEMESKGYTVADASSQAAAYYSFDNRGSVGKGKWTMESEELVLRVELQNPDRGPWKAGFVFAGSASEGLQVRMYSLNDSGDLATPARATFKFKKVKAVEPSK